jgi:lipoyl(octanoyl) transferase
MTREIRCLRLGNRSYEKVHRYQLELVETARERDYDLLLLCSHPPVVTLGKQSTAFDLLGWSGETHQIKRGGKATYHGPGQFVAYPILDLRYYGLNLGGYLRALQMSLVDFCREFDLQARANPDYAGVWVIDPSDNQEKKLASIGIAVRRWITYHGIAINLSLDEQAFKGILSCGMDSTCMTALDRLLLQNLPQNDIEQKITKYLLESLSQLSESCQV